MARINLPPGCQGFADGDSKWMASKGPGGNFVNLDETDPRDRRALQKLKNQDYASAGLVDAGPEKAFIRGRRANGRWCRDCNFLGHSWMQACSRCGGKTEPEAEMDRDYSLADKWPEFRPLMQDQRD